MYGGRTRKWSTNGTTRRFAVASAIAVVATAAFLPGAGFGASAAAARAGQMKIPAGLADAIHARLGAGVIRTSAAARSTLDPHMGIGVALSADGTTALVGAPGVAGFKGAAYIFHASDAGSWSSSGTPVATLTTNHGSTHGYFGFAVGLSADGTTAFVGAPVAGTHASGAIYVFHVSAEDAWSSSSTPTATLTVNGSFLFGISLGLSSDGTTLVAGVPFYQNLSGGAVVFHAASEAGWASTSIPTAILTNADQSEDDGAVGFAVAISGDGTTALVSDAGNPNGGGALLYHASAEDAWATSSTPTAILSDSNIPEGYELGSAVALSGDGTVALLGAYGVNSKTGAVDVFHSSGAWTSTSTPTATLTAAGGSSNSEFGVNVVLSTDGKTALVLADGVAAFRGAAYIFHVSDEGAWASSSTPTATLTKTGAHARDFLGIGVLSADGATALVGAPGVRKNTGAAYVFHASDASSWASSSAPNATLTNDALAHCVVPKLKGLRLPVAKFALAVGRCNLGRVTKVHVAHKKGRVLAQNRKAGRRLAIGAKVGVRVGK
jgi:hypothetical protein